MMPDVKPSTNGHAVAQPTDFSRWFEAKRKVGTDEVPPEPTTPEVIEVSTASMADGMKRVAGIRYLVREWIPFGMLTMILAPPGGGISAFCLWAIVRPIIVGACLWFNGMIGPKKPGYVLWCDTEGSLAITIQR